MTKQDGTGTCAEWDTKREQWCENIWKRYKGMKLTGTQQATSRTGTEFLFTFTCTPPDNKKKNRKKRKNKQKKRNKKKLPNTRIAHIDYPSDILGGYG